MTDSYIYHVAEEARWKKAGDEGYYPPGFEKDNFIHGTKEPHLVMHVANRFLSGSAPQFLSCSVRRAVLEQRQLPSCCTFCSGAILGSNIAYTSAH